MRELLSQKLFAVTWVNYTVHLGTNWCTISCFASFVSLAYPFKTSHSGTQRYLIVPCFFKKYASHPCSFIVWVHAQNILMLPWTPQTVLVYPTLVILNDTHMHLQVYCNMYYHPLLICNHSRIFFCKLHISTYYLSIASVRKPYVF